MTEWYDKKRLSPTSCLMSRVDPSSCIRDSISLASTTWLHTSALPANEAEASEINPPRWARLPPTCEVGQSPQTLLFDVPVLRVKQFPQSRDEPFILTRLQWGTIRLAANVAQATKSRSQHLYAYSRILKFIQEFVQRRQERHSESQKPDLVVLWVLLNNFNYHVDQVLQDAWVNQQSLMLTTVENINEMLDPRRCEKIH